MSLTREIIQKRSNEIHNSEYLIIGEFININTKCLVLHTTCGYKWDINLSNHIYKKKGCPSCYGNKKMNIKDAQLFSNNIHNNEYEILDFKSTSNKSSICHLTCSHIFSMKISSHLYLKQGCPKCYKKEKLSIDIVIERSRILYGEEYEILSNEYKNINSRLTVKHKCGHIWDITSNNFINNKRKCPKCYKKEKLSIDKIKRLSNELHNNEYEFIGEYINCNIPVLTRHIKCGHIWSMYIIPHLNKERLCGCPSCSMSIGEKKIKNFLVEKDIEFTFQKKFEGCFNKKQLIFDFFLPTLNICIEYDGEQHFNPVKFFGGKNKFDKQVKNDIIKNKFCKNNNIELLRISYSDSIDEIYNKYSIFFPSVV